jgi:hypothetical protein
MVRDDDDDAVYRSVQVVAENRSKAIDVASLFLNHFSVLY